MCGKSGTARPPPFEPKRDRVNGQPGRGRSFAWGAEAVLRDIRRKGVAGGH